MAQTKNEDRVDIILAKKRLSKNRVLFLVKWIGHKPDSWETGKKTKELGSQRLKEFYRWAKKTGVDASKNIARQEALNSKALRDNGNYRITIQDHLNRARETEIVKPEMAKKKVIEVMPKVNKKGHGKKNVTQVQSKVAVTSKVRNVKSVNKAKAEKVCSKAQKVLKNQPEKVPKASQQGKEKESQTVQKPPTNSKASQKPSPVQSNRGTQSKVEEKQKLVKKQESQPKGEQDTKKIGKSTVKTKVSPNVPKVGAEKGSPKNNKSKNSKMLGQVADIEGCSSSGSDSDTLYSLAGVSTPKKLKVELVDIRRSPSLSTSRSSTPQPDSEISFKITSPVRKILLKDSVKKKNKFRNKPAEAETKSGISPALPLPATPSSLFCSSYKQDKTPPGTPTRLSTEATPTKPGDLYSGFPRIPNVPVIPNSPAASYKTLMKTLQNLQADRGIKRKHGDDMEPIERRSSVRQSESIYKYKEIAVKKASGYTQIWLMTHTKMKNSLNPQVLSELSQALHNAKFDDSHVVMLSGYGSTFCSGIDLQYLTTGDCRSNAKKMADSLKDFVKTMISFPKPLVAAVNGSAVGLGTTILPLCDIVYASDKATFSCPYSRLGHTPEGCGSYTLPQVLGMAMANEMLLAGRRLTAQEACQAGLVSQVFWPTSLMQEVIPRVQQMAQTSAKALEASKLLIRSHQKSKLEFTCDSECTILSERWSSADCVRTMRTYLEREEHVL